MNFQINYPIKDYKLDLVEASYIKTKLAYRGKFVMGCIVIIISIGIIITGLEFSNMLESTFIGIGLAILLLAIFYLWLIITAKKGIFKKINYIETNLNFSFSDDLFTYRDQEEYHEYNWSVFSKFLLMDGYIFLIENHIETAYSLSQKQFNSEKFEELHDFLASKLPVWKP